MSGETTFLANVQLIDRVSGMLCRRHRVVSHDAEDFVGHVRLKCIEGGYAVFEKFRGDSTLPTYLTVVIGRWFEDYRIASTGRWRPSAAALRVGPVGVMLERQIARAGCTINEAIARVLAGHDHSYTERELRAMVRMLPPRFPLRPQLVSDEEAAEMASENSAESAIDESERDSLMTDAASALETALRQLSDEDRLIVSMRFLDGHSVAEIARALRIEQKPLYRRLDRSMSVLRALLEARGVTNGTIVELLSDGGC